MNTTVKFADGKARRGVIACLAWILLVSTAPALGSVKSPGIAPGTPPGLKDVGITEHLGSKVSLQQLSFRDESGQSVPLSKFFQSKKPVLFSLVYYECPMLCNFLLNGLVDGLKGLDWTPGNQFEIVTVSINPKEGADLASKKKASYLSSYGRPEAASGWHFLTGDESQIKTLASELGFGYRYDEKEKQYAHSAALFILTPEGTISRYLYGIQYPAKDLKLALLEASNGRVGTVIERFLLFCYQYDPAKRGYSFYAFNLLKVGGLVTVLILGGYLAVFWNRQRRLALAEAQKG